MAISKAKRQQRNQWHHGVMAWHRIMYQYGENNGGINGHGGENEKRKIEIIMKSANNGGIINNGIGNNEKRNG
jgi:hypothetical protein